jgi:hypothetical protein
MSQESENQDFDNISAESEAYNYEEVILSKKRRSNVYKYFSLNSNTQRWNCNFCT